MEVEFADSLLEALEADENVRHSYDARIVRGFRKVMLIIRSAVDERDLVNMRSFRYEKLKGNRSHQHSLRINDQWRLIIELRRRKPKNLVFVVEIADYH